MFGYALNVNGGGKRKNPASRGIFYVLLVLLVACETPGSAPGEATYSVFFTPVDHIEQLLEKNDLDSASEVYANQRQFFAEKSQGRRVAADKLVERLIRKYMPKAESAKGAMDDISWPSAYERWNEVRATLKNASNVIKDLEGHAILLEPAYRPAILNSLKNRLSDLEGQIGGSTADIFTNYPIATAPNFFARYPVWVDAGEHFNNHGKIWRTHLENADIDELLYIYNTYKAELSQQLKADLGQRYYTAFIKNDSVGEKGDFRAILKAITATRAAGIVLDDIPGTRIVLVEVTSRTLLKEGQIEFPVAVDVDLPFNAEKSDFDTAFGSSVAKNADILVLIDVATARVDREIVAYEQVSSEFRSGTRTEPNPNYNLAQNQVNQARLDVQLAAMNSASTDAQYCYGYGCLGKALAQIANGIALGAARKKVEEAMANLQSTPMILEKPVYNPYQFQKATIDVAKEASVHYYIIDRLAKTYLRDTFDLRQKQTFTVAYKVREKDRNRYAQLLGTDKEEDVVAFEEGAVDVKLSSILEQFSDKVAQIRPLPSLADIRAEVLTDKNRALAEYRKQQYKAAPTKDDRRFDSVVVVFNPAGGTGTGFFVRDDIVLTNYHVIEGSQFVELKLFNGQETFGKIIANDIRLDLALIKVQARGKPVAFFSDRDLPLGETVEAIGHPKGLEFSITRGIISALRKLKSQRLEGGKAVRFIQTDVAVNPGNSGGPLFLGDKVVGVNTQKLVATQLEGLSFAIHFSEVLDFLKKKGIAISAGS
ncbi:MAG: trypsin-like peptidase domain-containing protein [Proteobacteria bacterium]|nr:trypsin-like peptidase domain-containing protein [Pseudomonadota bacterium]